MKKFWYSLLFLFFFTQGLFAQSNFSSFGLNLGTNLLIGDSKVIDSKISPNVGAFVIYKHSDYLNLKLQTGYGKLGVGFTQGDFSTSFVPLELIGMFSLKNGSKLTPFLHAGLGAFGFRLDGSPTYFDGIFLGGAGFSVEINPTFTFMTSADLRYTTGDDFNRINGGMKDGYFSLQTGIAYNFNKSDKKYKREDKFPHNMIIAQNIDKPSADEKAQKPPDLEPAITEEKPPLKKEKEKQDKKLGNTIVDNNKTLFFEGINFNFDSAELSNKAITTLEKIIHILMEQTGIKIEIQGHTDSVGDLNYNQKLSIQRANAVRKYYLKKGIPQERLITKGFGEQSPIAANTTKDGRAKNRRVEFINLKANPKILTMFK